MARSVNKVILLGNLGKDAELTYLSSGTPVSKFTLATNRNFKDKNGEWQEETEWHNIVLWGPSAERISQYLTKGTKIYLEGRIKSRTWEGKDGQKHYATDIVADQIVLVSGRGEEGGAGGGQARSTAQARPAAAAPQQQGGSAPREESFSQEITDDDIPF